MNVLNKYPFLIAGPCSAESEEQVLMTAHQLKNLNTKYPIRAFRAGVWKPRTRPNSFEGHQEKALPWLIKAKEETGLPLAVEVATPHHVEQALKAGIDILWIGARTTTNPFSVQEIADSLRGVKIPVMVKNPINADLQLWIGAIERIEKSGVSEITAIHRGFSLHQKSMYRNPPLFKIPIELRRLYPLLPIITDPSHITGNSSLIEKICLKAIEIGTNGFMIETHPAPRFALSDKDQQITPQELEHLINRLDFKRSDLSNFKEDIAKLRAEIDQIDHEILSRLKERMDIVFKIAEIKKIENVTAFQSARFDELIDERRDVARNLGINEDLVKDIFDAIHAESIKFQTDFFHP